MSEFITKAMLSGLGLASLTKDAIEQMARELAKRSKLSEHEGRRLMRDLQRKSVRTQKAMHQTMEGAVHTFVNSLNLATLDDVQAAGKRTAKSAKRTKKPAAAARKRAPKGASPTA